ncbi:hypothetical protein GCM10008967_17680 [Bacillus carboniphilus]|uniref:Uncharacterized protein n=1 Tax=Bacillus carboniphilus TaxID=86663 RepID=A0ABN0W778_9BACI
MKNKQSGSKNKTDSFKMKDHEFSEELSDGGERDENIRRLSRKK